MISRWYEDYNKIFQIKIGAIFLTMFGVFTQYLTYFQIED